MRYDYKTFSPIQFPLKNVLEKAETKIRFRTSSPLKGVKSLMGKDKEAEPIEKGILRQKYGLSVFKDGTIRFDATNEPLTHFMPAFINISIPNLHDLGYTRDSNNNELNSSDQVIESLKSGCHNPFRICETLVENCQIH